MLHTAQHLPNGIELRMGRWQANNCMTPLTDGVVHSVLELWPVLLTEDQQIRPCRSRWDGQPAVFQPRDEVCFFGRCGGATAFICKLWYGPPTTSTSPWDPS